MNSIEPPTESPPFPIDAGQITAGWLTTILQQSGVLSAHGSVADVRTEAVGAGAGIASSLARITLTYDGDAGKAPHSIIAKFSATDPGVRQTVALILGAYEREVRFYAELAPAVRIGSPACFFGGFDPRTLDSLILLEDLAGASMGAGDETCTETEAEAAVTAIAPMHAAFWNSPKLAGMSWLFSEYPPQPAFIDMIRDRYPLFRSRFGGKVPGRLASAFGRLAAGEAPRFSGPMTLCHGDFHRNNVCFTRGGTTVIFDWQLVSCGPPALDIQRFMMAMLREPDGIERIERFLTTYMAALIREGVTDYPLGALRRDCRSAAILRLLRAIGIGGEASDLDTARIVTVERIIDETGLLLGDADIEEAFA